MSEQRLPRILAIDDDPVWLDQIPAILEDEAEVVGQLSIDQGIGSLEKESFDIILLDLNFADDLRTGLDVFRRIHGVGCDADVIVISGETSPDRLVEVFNAGVTRFIPKPADPARIRREIRAVLEQREVRRRAFSGATGNELDPFFGTSAAIGRLKDQVEVALRGDTRDILIQGETGTGKDVLAKFLAKRFDRSGRLLPVHCGALADGIVESELFGHVKGAFTGADRDRIGMFEAANGGVVFLDEIGEMPLTQQPKLLRVLQERKVQRLGTHEERKVAFRLIAATHVDLATAVQEKKFREDLYFRIAQAVIRVPALRERQDDIPLFVTRFLQVGSGQATEISPQAMALLTGYHWPGNVRQLEAVVRNLKCVASGSVIREKDVCGVLPELAALMPGLTRSPLGTYAQSLLFAEKKKFEDALRQANGYRDEAAKLLGMSRATFFRRAKELGVVRSRTRPGGSIA